MPDKSEKPSLIKKIKNRARVLKTNVHALYFAYKDPRVPWYAKAIIAVVLTYSLTHIDLIPDFIPILGYIDDLIIIPLGIALALKLIPPEAMEEARDKAKNSAAKPVGRAGTIIVLIIWAAGIVLLVIYSLKLVREGT